MDSASYNSKEKMFAMEVWIHHLLIRVGIFFFLLLFVQEVQSQGLRRLKVLYAAISGEQALAHLTKEAGLFEKNGLDVELVLVKSPQATAAMVAKEILSMTDCVEVLEAAFRELGDVPLGNTRGRGSKNHITLFYHSGGQGVSDMPVAALLYKKANAMGIGKEI